MNVMFKVQRAMIYHHVLTLCRRGAVSFAVFISKCLLNTHRGDPRSTLAIKTSKPYVSKSIPKI